MSVTISITQPVLNQYSPRQYNADVYCMCCGRGIPNRINAQVAIASKGGALGTGGAGAAGIQVSEITFEKIDWDKGKGTESVFPRDTRSASVA